MQIVIGNRSDTTNNVLLTGGELMLLHQVASEAANGIRLDGFSRQIGISKERARSILRTLADAIDSASAESDTPPSGDFDLAFSATDGRALRNATELVMQDLGHEEFSTRTGFELSDAAEVLNKLNPALLAPLHIGHPQTLQTERR